MNVFVLHAIAATFILGGQIAGEEVRLLRIYADGNFIEAGADATSRPAKPSAACPSSIWP